MASLQNLRFRCAISWMQALYDDVTFPFPREILSYPFTDLYTSTIRPELITWLTCGVPYLRIVAHIGAVPYNAMTSFQAIIHKIPDMQLDVVSLGNSDPFMMEQHLSLIESILKLYYTTFLSLDSVSRQLHRFSGIYQTFESIEEGLLTWLRLVCDTLKQRDKIQVPDLVSLSSSLSNGCLLLLLLHFYIPQYVQLNNGKFSADIGLEDAFHNATLVSNACAQVSQLNFCLSPQGIVRSSDPVMLPYVVVSLTSLFIGFQVSEPAAIHRPPALYGDLIGQPRLRAKFHSMDSVTRVGSRNLITPSTENLLRSDASIRHPRTSRFQTVRSSSTPDISYRGAGMLRPADTRRISSGEPMPSSASINIPNPDMVVTQDIEVFPELVEPKSGWSECVKSDTSSSEVSLEEGQVLTPANTIQNNNIQHPMQNNGIHKSPTENNGIYLHIFPVVRESPNRNPLSLLLRMEANRLRTDQSNERAKPSEYDVIKEQLGQLAFSYLATNQVLSFEEYVQQKLDITSNAKTLEIDQGYIESPQEQMTSEYKNTHIELTPSDKSSKPMTFYVAGTGGDDVTDTKSPFATLKVRNMLKLLETRNSARQVSRKPIEAPTFHKTLDLPPNKPISPSASCQSIHTNPPVPLPSNHRARIKRFGSANDVTTHSAVKHKSNKQIIKNAICDVCLAGGPNTAKKVEILSSLSAAQSAHFLILFRDIIGCKFRGLYAYHQDTETATRIGGAGPRVLVQDMFVKLYKYNSGAKEFQEIPARRVSYSTDGVTIPDNLWAGKRKL